MTKSRKAALVALFPLTGMLGVHMYMVGRKKEGRTHLILCVIPLLCYLYAWFEFTFLIHGSVVTTFGVFFSVLATWLFPVSYAGAIIEAFRLWMGEEKPVEPAKPAQPEQQMASTASVQGAWMGNDQTEALVSGEVKAESDEQKPKERKWAFLIVVIPYALMTIFYRLIGMGGIAFSGGFNNYLEPAKCLIFNCYKTGTLYGIGSIAIVILAVAGIFMGNSKKTASFYVCLVFLLLAILNAGLSFIWLDTANILFI